MIGLHDIRNLVASLFIMLNEKTYILFRIEFLVVLVTLLFLMMFIIDIFRRYIHNTTMKAMFSLFDAVSDSIVIYLLGAMQTASFKNQLFPVWALVLVIFRYSIDFISGYGVPDPGGRRLTELNNVTKLLGSAFLILNRGSSRFTRPLWSLWALQILRILYRLLAHFRAIISVWHGGSSGLISEYMRTDRDPNMWKPDECDPSTMKGYQYLVYGEFVRLEKPRYVLTLKQQTGSRSSLITLDKIWGCNRQLCPRDMDILKDHTLSFALSRLLRCRLEDVTLQRDIFRINRELVKKRIIEEDAERAFRVMEMQLAFVNDYFNTHYPIVFCQGLASLFLNLLLSMVTFCVVLWLSVSINKVYKPPEGELAHVVRGLNVDMIITWVFLFFLMFKEIWEMITYLLSDWTRLLLVCRYAQFRYAQLDRQHIKDPCVLRLIKSFFTSKIIDKRWHGLMDQYIFLESYNDRPRIWNFLHKVTTGMVPNKDDGTKLSSAINVPKDARQKVLKSLGAFLETRYPNHAELADSNRNFGEPTIPKIPCLPKVIMTLSGNGPNGNTRKNYGWACYNLPTSSHIILVWHIATSFCELKLAKEHHISLNPGFLCSLSSCFTDCCPSKRIEKKVEKKLCGELQKNYITANSLSRYCAYLLVWKPDLIPDSFLVPKMVFQKTVKSARDSILKVKGCDSLEQRYEKLMTQGENAAKDAVNIEKGEDVLKQGALLGMKLMDDESEEGRWEILAGVWAELLVHIAPTWNAEAHKDCLESGGEYISHIWALLWHCGIERSSLWPVRDAPEDHAPLPSQENNAVNTNAGQTQQDGANTSSQVCEEDESGGTREPEANNLCIGFGPRGLEGRASTEIEEASRAHKK